MFSDYNGYFKGGGTHRAPDGGSRWNVRRAMPLRDEGAHRQKSRVIGVRPEQTDGLTKKTTLPAAALGRRARRRRAARDGCARTAYIRSIIALPKPEQETWVAPGMSRAKS
jgi:hypothetical protein